MKYRKSTIALTVVIILLGLARLGPFAFQFGLYAVQFGGFFIALWTGMRRDTETAEERSLRLEKRERWKSKLLFRPGGRTTPRTVSPPKPVHSLVAAESFATAATQIYANG